MTAARTRGPTASGRVRDALNDSRPPIRRRCSGAAPEEPGRLLPDGGRRGRADADGGLSPPTAGGQLTGSRDCRQSFHSTLLVSMTASSASGMHGRLSGTQRSPRPPDDKGLHGRGADGSFWGPAAPAGSASGPPVASDESVVTDTDLGGGAACAVWRSTPREGKGGGWGLAAAGDGDCREAAAGMHQRRSSPSSPHAAACSRSTARSSRRATARARAIGSRRC
jgi:hypothetical protein